MRGCISLGGRICRMPANGPCACWNLLASPGNCFWMSSEVKMGLASRPWRFFHVFSTSSVPPLCHVANKFANKTWSENNVKKILLIFAHFGRTSEKVAQGTAMNAAWPAIAPGGLGWVSALPTSPQSSKLSKTCMSVCRIYHMYQRCIHMWDFTKASLINVLRICFIFSASPWPPSQLAPPRDQNDGVLRSLLSIWRFKMFKAVASAVLTIFSSLARSSASASDEGRTTNAHGFHNVVVQYCLCTLRFNLHAEIKRIPIASWKCLTRRCLNLVNPLHHVRARSVWYQAKFNRPPPDNVDGDRIACLTISHTLPMDHCLFQIHCQTKRLWLFLHHGQGSLQPMFLLRLESSRAFHQFAAMLNEPTRFEAKKSCLYTDSLQGVNVVQDTNFEHLLQGDAILHTWNADKADKWLNAEDKSTKHHIGPRNLTISQCQRPRHLHVHVQAQLFKQVWKVSWLECLDKKTLSIFFVFTGLMKFVKNSRRVGFDELGLKMAQISLNIKKLIEKRLASWHRARMTGLAFCHFTLWLHPMLSSAILLSVQTTREVVCYPSLSEEHVGAERRNLLAQVLQRGVRFDIAPAQGHPQFVQQTQELRTTVEELLYNPTNLTDPWPQQEGFHFPRTVWWSCSSPCTFAMKIINSSQQAHGQCHSCQNSVSSWSSTTVSISSATSLCTIPVSHSSWEIIQYRTRSYRRIGSTYTYMLQHNYI